jgi:hypothetical protein
MKTKALLLTVLLVGALAIPVFGTTVPRMDLQTLIRNSDNIIQGKIEGMDVVVEQRRPYTRVRVRVDDPMYARRGVRRQTIFLKFLGGRMDTPQGPVDMKVSGMPSFNVGDNVILFLREQPDGNNSVVGMNQGKYLIVNEVAVASISGVDLVDPKTGKLLPSGYTESAPVEAFKAKIRELLK